MQKNYENKSNFFNKFILTLLIIVWSSCIWEVGLEFFTTRYGFSIFRIFSLIFIVSYLTYIMVNKIRIKIYFPFEIKILLLYIIMNLITLMYSSKIELSLYFTYINLYYFTLMLLSLHFLQNQNKEVIVFIFKIIGYFSLTVILGLSLYLAITFDISFVRPSYNGKFTISAFQDYNVMTVSLLMAAFLIMQGKEVNTKNNIIFLFLVSIVILVGVMSGSRRSVVLYFPIVLLVSQFFIFKINRKTYLQSLFYIIILCLIVVLFQYYINDINMTKEYMAIGARLERGLSFFNENSKPTGRELIWENSMKLYDSYSIQKIFFGDGYFSYLDSNIMKRENGITFSPHNFMLSSLLNGGIVSLLIVIFLIFSLYLAYFRINLLVDIWSKIFIFSFLLIWIVSVSISGSDFLATRQIYLFILFLSINRYSIIVSNKYDILSSGIRRKRIKTVY